MPEFYKGLGKFDMNNANQTLNLPVKGGIQPLLGETITSLSTGNTYTIGPQIGEGNFGIVYSCSDDWDNELAVKVLKPIRLSLDQLITGLTFITLDCFFYNLFTPSVYNSLLKKFFRESRK